MDVDGEMLRFRRGRMRACRFPSSLYTASAQFWQILGALAERYDKNTMIHETKRHNLRPLRKTLMVGKSRSAAKVEKGALVVRARLGTLCLFQ